MVYQSQKSLGTEDISKAKHTKSMCIFCRIWVRSWYCSCFVTWFCYQLIAKPGNKTAAVSWPDPYSIYQSCGPILSSKLSAFPRIPLMPMNTWWAAGKLRMTGTYILHDGNRSCLLLQSPGPCLNVKTIFPGMGIPMLKIRWLWDHLIFNMGIPILVRWHLFIETAPRSSANIAGWD